MLLQKLFGRRSFPDFLECHLARNGPEVICSMSGSLWPCEFFLKSPRMNTGVIQRHLFFFLGGGDEISLMLNSIRESLLRDFPVSKKSCMKFGGLYNDPLTFQNLQIDPKGSYETTKQYATS